MPPLKESIVTGLAVATLWMGASAYEEFNDADALRKTAAEIESLPGDHSSQLQLLEILEANKETEAAAKVIVAGIGAIGLGAAAVLKRIEEQD